MDHQYEEEPASKFGTLSVTKKDSKNAKCERTFRPENNKASKLSQLLKNSSSQQHLLSVSRIALENNFPLDKSSQLPACSQSPLKIPRIILTHPSTSDEDIDQSAQDQEFDLDETDITEDNIFLDCMKSSGDTP